MAKERILVVDDEPEILETTRWAFELAGFDVHTASSAEEALPQAETLQPNILLIDYRLPGMDGLALFRAVKAKLPGAIAVMITGLTHDTQPLEEESRRLGVAGFLHKPLQMEEVLKVVRERMGAA